jgi:hypothetical protein
MLVIIVVFGLFVQHMWINILQGQTANEKQKYMQLMSDNQVITGKDENGNHMLIIHEDNQDTVEVPLIYNKGIFLNLCEVLWPRKLPQ